VISLLKGLKKKPILRLQLDLGPPPLQELYIFCLSNPMISGRDGQEDDFDQPYTGKKCTRRALLIDVQLEEWVL